MNPPGPGGRGHAGGIPGEKAANFGPTVRRLVSLLRPARTQIVYILFLSALGVIGQVAGPKMLGDATDFIYRGVLGHATSDMAGLSTDEAVEALRAAGNTEMAEMVGTAGATPGAGIDFAGLARILLLVAAIYVIAAAINFWAGWIIRHIVQDLGWRLRRDAQAKIDRLPLSYIDQRSRGDLLSRVTNDVDNISQTLMQTLNSLFQNVLLITGIVAMMVWISPTLALLTFVILPPGVYLATRIMKKAQPQFRAQWDATGEVSDTVEEAFTGHEVVAAFGLEEDFATEFTARNDTLRAASFKAQFISGLMQPAMGLVSNIGYVLVAVVGGLQVAAGTITLGNVQAFIQYSRQFTHPLGQLASMANLLQSGAASAERIFTFLDAEEMAEDAAGTLPKPTRGKVEFRNVSFGYEPGTTIINNLSFVAMPGENVAIVGPTGAGKTTLVNLLLRFYEIDSGTILVDDVDISTVSKEALRENMSMVLQDTWLFEGTIEENIGFGRDNPTHEQVVAAAKASSVDRIVRQMPEGYDTVVNDEGEGTSVGEKQLLTIARAFLADPQILILDEATSSVDTRTEVLVQAAMNKLQQGRTSFIIAHRLSTIRHADTIIVMEDGDVVEQGNHEDLLAAEGAYYRLYRSQFEGGEDEPATS